MSALHAAVARQIEIDLAPFPGRWVPLPQEAEAPGLLVRAADFMADAVATLSAVAFGVVDLAQAVAVSLAGMF